MPLVHFFETSFGRTTERRMVLVEVESDGASGWGEVTAGENPFYNEEWTESAWLIVRDYVAPQVLGRTLGSAAEVSDLTAHIRGHQMARAGLEVAVWDLAARLHAVPSGGTSALAPRSPAVRSASELSTSSPRSDTKARRLPTHQDQIKPGWDIDVVRTVRERFPAIKLMADANSAYRLEDAARLRELDAFYLMMIEQPLAHDDIIDHAKLQAQLETPICLDECIRNAHMAEQAIGMHACGIIKSLGRCRGEAGVSRRSRGIPVWCGGMPSGRRPRQHRIATLPIRTAGRRIGEQAVLGARHHPAGGGDDRSGHDRDPRRTRLRLRARPRLHPRDYRP
jgi:O-succinylbenzoate synthase